MIIVQKDLPYLYRVAQEELVNPLGAMPTQSFYARKIEAVWERARHTRVYAQLGPYEFERFLSSSVTSRQELKERPLDFLAVPLQQALKYYETTGTTGLPTPTPRLREDIVWNTVSVAEAWRALLEPDDRVLGLLPSDIVPVADLMVGVCEYLGVAHAKAYPFTTGISDWDRLERLGENFQPTVLFVAPGVAQQLTRVLKQRNTFERFSSNVRGLMLLGEVNTAAFRKRLGGWWNAQVFDASYGSTETGTLAASCRDGWQHLLVAANYFEIEAGDGPRALPERGDAEGRLIVTPLNLHARPLLRLNTGDVVTVSHGCTCGAAAPKVVVHGRVTDGIQIRGRAVTARAVEEIIYSVTDATGYMIEINSEGDYARLLLERSSDWRRDDEGPLVRQLKEVSTQRLDVEWNDIVFLNNLPATTKSGASQKSWKRSNIRFIEAGSK